MCSLKGTWNLGDMLGKPWTDSTSAHTAHLCPVPSVLLTCFLEGQVSTEQDSGSGQSQWVTTSHGSCDLSEWEPRAHDNRSWDFTNLLASSDLEILLSLFLLRSVGAPKEKLSPAENLAIFGKESSPSTISVSVWKVPFQGNPLGHSNGLQASARFYFQKHPCYLVIPIFWGETQLSLTWYFSE